MSIACTYQSFTTAIILFEVNGCCCASGLTYIVIFPLLRRQTGDVIATKTI